MPETRQRIHIEEFPADDHETINAYVRTLQDSTKSSGWQYNGWRRRDDGIVEVQSIFTGPRQDQTLLMDAVPDEEVLSGTPVQPNLLDWCVREIQKLRREVDDINRALARQGSAVTGRTPMPGEIVYKPGVASPAPRPWGRT
jgi:hypothetical protein